jgi:hypothetical protein
MSLSDEYYIKILNNIAVYIYRYGNLFLYILGNIGNLLSMIILFRKSWRKNVCIFYFNICLLLSSIYLNSTILGFIFLIGFNINVQNSSVILCKFFYFLTFFISTLFPTVLILASIDRLFISSQNINADVYKSKRFAYFAISFSVFFWFVFSFPLLIEIHLVEIQPSVFVCSYDSSKFYFVFLYYFLMTIEVLFIFILFILCIVSFKNIRRIRKIPRRQRPQIQSIRERDFQILRCLFIYDIIYIISGIFSAVFSVYIATTKFQKRMPLEKAICDFLSDLFAFFSFIYYCVNFFIFIIVSNAFRKKLKRLVYKLFGKKDVIQIRRTQNHQENLIENNIELNDVV